MSKKVFAGVILCVCLAVTVGCSKDEDSTTTAAESASSKTETDKKKTSPEQRSEIVEITETMFMTQINDIYINIEDYKDKTVKIEGMYSVFYSQDMTQSASVVYRNGPGCCGNDGWGGFQLEYDGEWPKENDWIEVIGNPKLVSNGQYKDLYLEVISVEVKDERGLETVSR